MTNKEAIEVLKDLWRYEHSEFSEKDIREALNMAISALSKTPRETEYWKERSKSYERTIVALQKGIAEKQTDSVLEEKSYKWCKGCKEYDTEKHCCHRYSSFIRESLQDSINAVLEDIKVEIDKLPRIKVGNSNSPTVKYCIDERLIYEVLEKYISGKENKNE